MNVVLYILEILTVHNDISPWLHCCYSYFAITQIINCILLLDAPFLLVKSKQYFNWNEYIEGKFLLLCLLQHLLSDQKMEKKNPPKCKAEEHVRNFLYVNFAHFKLLKRYMHEILICLSLLGRIFPLSTEF